MNHPRRAHRLAVAIVLVVLVAACDGGGAGGSEGGGAIRFALTADAAELAGYQAMVQEFEETSELDVELSPFAERDGLMANLTTSIAGGDPPDVFLLNWRSYGQFAALGAIEPVEPYLEASEELSVDDFVATTFEAFRYGGETLTCMPQNTSSLVVYYHVGRFETAGIEPPRDGWTWDDLVAAAQQLTGDGVYGLGIDPQLIRVAPFVWSNGGELVDDPDQPTQLTLADGPSREALDWFLDLSLVHEVVPPDRQEQSLDKEARFLAGDLAMYVSSRVAVPTLRTIDDFEWDVGPLPRPADGELVNILHSDAYCMAAASDQHDAAWRFIEFAMSERGQTILAESGRTVPSRIDVADSPAFLQPDEPPANSGVYVRNIDRMRTSPTIGSWPVVEEVGDAILEDIFYGRIDREAGIAQLHEETDPLFEQVPGG